MFGDCTNCNDKFYITYCIDDAVVEHPMAWQQSETVERQAKVEKIGTCQEIMDKSLASILSQTLLYQTPPECIF